MKNACKVSLLSLALLVLTGCSGIVGNWTLESVTPEDAASHYTVVRMMLADDGTYCAMAKKAGEDVPSKGSYTFEDNKLCFTTSEGKLRSYDAKLIAMGSKLEVKAAAGDQEVTAIMKRGKCSGGCDKDKKAAE